MNNYRANRQSGNVFFAIFGAVALVGVLGAAVMTFMKGPLATSVKITRVNTAENQMAIGAQVAVMAAANTPTSGDCDSDAMVEPLEWRDAGASPKPTGGGLVPMSIGISKKDPWGTEYGYCTWDHGTQATCDDETGAGDNPPERLGGATTGGTAHTSVALISAGPDKVFTTTCRDFATADANADGDLLDAGDLPLVSKAAETDDDIIFTYTYDEATGASGGLWSIKSGDPGTAVINKNIETTGKASLSGGILLPDKSLITCDPSNAGVMAMNANAIEICDGAGWEAITGGVAGGGLVLSPNVSSGMDVSGVCGNPTCYSSNVTFTLTNNLSPAAASVALATSLSNTTNFEFVSDGCNGLSLASGASCQMVVRAKASGNVSYSGSLQILGNNSPLAMLDGTGSGFAGCNTGGMAPGGYYVACGVGGYDLVVTPSGCTGGTTNPTCAGGTDTAVQQFSTLFQPSAVAGCCSSNGQQNTANLIAYSGGAYSFPAAAYCDALVYQGFDDWFLPSISELTSYFYPNRVAVGSGIAVGYYQSSSENNFTAGLYQALLMSTGASGSRNATSSDYVRCMRWTPTKTVTPTADTTPLSVTFNASYGGATEQRTSNAVTVYGVTQPVTISVSGAGGPEYSKNGGAYTSAAGTVTNGDQVTLRATSPALGLENVVSVTIGSSNFNWQVRTPGNNTIRVFTTSAASYTGNVGGAGGADATCTSVANAAGLPGGWVAVLGVGAQGDFSLPTRLPWNWKTLRNMNNQTVAVSLADFLDGTISAPMNYSQTGTVVGGSVWMGLETTGANGSTSNRCDNWTGTSTGGRHGDSSATTGGGYFYASAITCAANLRLLCMESNAAGVDTDPDAVSIRPQVTFASGGLGTSNTVTITGVTDEVSVTITPSAGTANIIKDGVSVGATTTMAGLNQTLAFTLTAPTVLGTKNTATINIGPDTYNWWVGYADSARESRVFVTSTIHSAWLGGLSGADSVCMTRAAASPYGLGADWVAMLSDGTYDMADRIPWNWGTLKRVDGTVVVNGGYNDLLDGTIAAPINVTETGGAPPHSYVRTGSLSNGMKNKYGASGALTNYCLDYSSNMATDASYHTALGITNSTSSTWLQFIDGSHSSCGTVLPLYCIEDVDNAVADTTPNALTVPYPVQVPTSSRQTSAAVAIGGMSTGVTVTLSVTGTGGNPKFKVNGGAETASATVQNGDSIVFLMDAPATGNDYNKMTISLGSNTEYWRVWTGDTSGSAVKRVFVTSAIYPIGGDANSFTGVTGADARCQDRATAAGLGGSWKAIISGTTEAQYAVNRIGYNWSELRLVNGTTVVFAPNLWKTETIPFLVSLNMSETSGTYVTDGWPAYSNTKANGSPYATYDSNSYNCSNWTNYYGIATTGTIGTTSSSWINSSTSYCGYNGWRSHFYCIEQ